MVEWTGTFAYQQVADDLRQRIADDEFAGSGKLPSLAEIQERYDVTVTVARSAIRQLNLDGLAVSHQGKGAFLTSDATRTARLSDTRGALVEMRDELARLRVEVGELRQRVATLEES